MTFRPAIVALGIGLVLQPALLDGVTIDFENVPKSTIIGREEKMGQYPGTPGLWFSISKIIEPRRGTASPTQALQADTGLVEFHADPLVISFDAGQSMVRLFAGLDQQTYGKSVHAVLRAFDGQGKLIFGGSKEASIPAGPTFISTELRVSSAQKNIRRVELQYDGWYKEVIDSLEFDTPISAPSDTIKPKVTVTKPIDGAISGVSTFVLTGTISENYDLSRVYLEISQAGHSQQILQIPFDGSAPNFSFGGSTLFGNLWEGVNTVTVTAWDVSGNSGSDSVSVSYHKPPPIVSTVDVYCTGIEVTQAINSSAYRDPHAVGTVMDYNGVPLVADKTTVVRVYGHLRGSSIPIDEVFCDLVAKRDGCFLAGRPKAVDAQPNGLTLFPSDSPEDKRADLAKTWNYILPGEWIEEGNIELIARLGYARECAGCDDLFNTARLRAVRFKTTAPLHIYPLEACVRRSPNVPAATCDAVDPKVMIDAFTASNAALPATYPIADGDVLIHQLPNAVFKIDGDFVNIKPTEPAYGAMTSPRMEAALDYVYKRLYSDQMGALGLGIAPIFLPNPLHLYAAVVPPPITKYVGIGKIGKPASVSKVDGGSSFDFDSFTVAHELGHNFGFHHAPSVRDSNGKAVKPPCDDAEGENHDYPYYIPYRRSSIGDYGIDPRSWITPGTGTGNGVLKDPNTHFDLMSYCHPQWISTYSYRRLFERIRAATPPSAKAKAKARGSKGIPIDYVVVSGLLESDGSVRLDPAYLQSLPRGSADDPGEGAYHIVLRNIFGTAVFDRAFDPTESSTGAGGSFIELLPFPGGTASIELRRRTQLLASRTVSASAPSVRVLSPNGGESWSPSSVQMIRWTASDADGDPLEFRVLYSKDGGASWNTLALDLDVSELRVDTADLPGGSSALVRVLASDGILTASDDSDAVFSVASKPPVVEIIQPADGDTFAVGDSIRFVGTGTDFEDGPLEGSKLSWISDRDGNLGFGRRLDTRELSPGQHRVALVGGDSDENFTIEEVAIQIVWPELNLEITDLSANLDCARSPATQVRLSWQAWRGDPDDTRAFTVDKLTVTSRDGAVTTIPGPFPSSGTLVFPLDASISGPVDIGLEAVGAEGIRATDSRPLLVTPCAGASGSVRVDLGDPDIEDGLVLLQGATPEESAPATVCGPASDPREARILEGPDELLYFAVQDHRLGQVPYVRVRARVYDAPEAAGVELRLVSFAGPIPPLDQPGWFESDTVHTLTGSGQWRTLTWDTEVMDLSSSAEGNAHFYLAATGSVCVDAVSARSHHLDVGFSTEALRGADPILPEFVGEMTVETPRGEIGTSSVYLNISSLLVESGVRGWSLGLAVEGDGEIAGMELEGNAAEADGPLVLERIDPDRNGGLDGLVFVRVLAADHRETLPLVGTESILRIDLRSAEALGTVDQELRLFLTNGLVLDGPPVENVITVGDTSEHPAALDGGDLLVRFTSTAPPADGPVYLGFSPRRVSSALPFDGIVGEGIPGVGNAGDIVISNSPGGRQEGSVYVDVISELETNQVVGWSFSIEVEGDAEITSATTDGTTAAAVPDGIRDGFEITRIIDPARNGGRHGIVNATVLFTQDPVGLPFIGTESVLRIGLRPLSPQGEEEQVATLSFRDGLVGSGEPTSNVFTIGISSARAENQSSARVRVRFSESPTTLFWRGDSNADGVLDITDPIVTLGHLFLGDPAKLSCEKSADFNDDNALDITDPINLLQHVFLGGPPPASPYPECGTDPSEDDFECESFAPCEA